MTPNNDDPSSAVMRAIDDRSLYKKMLHMAGRIVGYQNAEDIVQTAYLRAYQQRHQYKRGNAHSWLYVIVKNAALTERKRQQRQATDSYSTIEQPAPSPSAEDMCIARETLDHIIDFHSTRSPIFSQALDIIAENFAEGKTYAVIASERGMPLNTVLTRIWRTRYALKE